MGEPATLYDRRGFREWIWDAGPNAKTTCNHGNSQGPADRSYQPGSG